MVKETEGLEIGAVRYNTMPRHCRHHRNPIRVVDVYYGGFVMAISVLGCRELWIAQLYREHLGNAWPNRR